MFNTQNFCKENVEYWNNLALSVTFMVEQSLHCEMFIIIFSPLNLNISLIGICLASKILLVYSLNIFRITVLLCVYTSSHSSLCEILKTRQNIKLSFHNICKLTEMLPYLIVTKTIINASVFYTEQRCIVEYCYIVA